MATDIAPALLEKIQKSFDQSLSSNKKASSLLKKINSGNATYKDAGNYAEQVGKSLSTALQANLTASSLPDGTMYYNIAQRTIRPMYEEEYQLASNAATTVQKSLNTKAGIGLNARTAKIDEASLEEIINMYCAAEYDGSIEELLETTEYFARQTVDETLKDNAEFQYQCGRTPRIVRRAGENCCAWCADVEGVYDYPNVPSDVYRRHDNCRCSVDYDPGGSSTRTQDVWSKQWSDMSSETEREIRKTIGLDNSVDKERLKTLNL